MKDVDSRWSVVNYALGQVTNRIAAFQRSFCKGCGRKHHTSLCRETAESNGMIADARTTTLLQTAKVKAFNPQTKRHVFVRAVFDVFYTIFKLIIKVIIIFTHGIWTFIKPFPEIC